MRAVIVNRFGSYENASVEETPTPSPGPGEILIRVETAPVNFVDLVVIGGNYQFRPALPFVPGKGPAGWVERLGADVEGFAPGDRVLGMAEIGGYAQFALAKSIDCHRLPQSMSFAQAASISLAYDTAWFALRDRARASPGETVLVLGATGAVGRAALQLARAMGLRTIAAASSPARFDLAKSAGAEACVDLSASDLNDSLRRQVFAVTEGRGADIVLDMLGGDPFDAALRALAWRGRLVVIGFAAGRIPTIKANYLMVKNIEVSGLQVSDYRKRRPDQMSQCYREIFDWFEQGAIDPGPSDVLPLEGFKEALRSIENRTSSRRIALAPWT